MCPRFDAEMESEGESSPRSWRRLHGYVGILGLIAFLGTGQVMHFGYDHLSGMAPGPRLLHRTCHIYLLWSSLLHLVLARSAPGQPSRWQRAGSGLLCLVPGLLLGSFFLESHRADLVRPMAAWGIYAAAAGVALLTVRRR